MSRQGLMLKLAVCLAVVVILSLTWQRAETVKAGLPCPNGLSATLMSVDFQPFGLGVVLFHSFLTGQVAAPRSARCERPPNAWPMPWLMQNASSLRPSRS
jgi:hypothetical protein